MNNASLTLTIEPLTEDRVKALVEVVAAAVTAAGGYELGDGNRDGAQIVSGEWWQPEYGCDSLGMTLDAIRARLVSAIGNWYGGCLKVVPGESPATPPAPPEGEVGELIAALRRRSPQNPLGLADSTIDRAIGYLQQLSAPAPAVVPVAVSERLPEAEDCDAEGRCWWSAPETDERWGNWCLAWGSCLPPEDFGATHWLPAHAISLPAPQGGEVEG